jgi:hypothetical protein
MVKAKAEAGSDLAMAKKSSAKRKLAVEELEAPPSDAKAAKPKKKPASSLEPVSEVRRTIGHFLAAGLLRPLTVPTRSYAATIGAGAAGGLRGPGP